MSDNLPEAIKKDTLICRNCQNATIGKTKGDEEMAKIGYRQCSAARTPEERGRYFTGGCKCVYPERYKAK